jgi:large repetitive protein
VNIPSSYRLFILAFLIVVDTSAQAQNVTTYKYDNQVSGINAKETTLTPANVNVASFGQLFKDPLDGQAYAQPLYLSNVTIPDKGAHNVIYIATCHDTVYAFDADTGGDPLWMTSFLAPKKGITSVPQPDVISGDTTPEIGIIGTPVIDPATGTLYVVSKTKETGRGDNHSHYVQKLHALDVATGQEKFNGPSVIGDTTCDHASERETNDYDYNLAANPQTPSVKGTGKAAIDGTVYFNALRTNQRPSLTLANGVVYIAWSSHGDNQPYHGWLIGYDAKTLAPIPNTVFCVTPDGEEGGIWQSGCGPSIDAGGNLYVSTSNGNYDGNKGGRNWSQSFLKFNTSSGLSTAKPPGGTDATFDYFTPYNEQGLSNGDVDIGSGGFMLFDAPGNAVPHLAIGSGKEGVFYVVNRENFGGFDAASDHVVQKFETSDRHEIMSTPIFFNNTLFYNRSGEEVRARAFVNGQFSDAFNHTVERFNGRGGGPVISANGTKDGILWMIDNGGPATVKAYSTDALAATPNNTAVKALYEGRMPDGGVKFVHPLVVNGKVYAVSASRKGNAISGAHLCAYGLLPTTGTVAPEMPTHVAAVSNSPFSVTISWISHDSSATGFIIKRGVGESGDLTQVGTAGDNSTSFNDNGVTGATGYRYSVSAVNRNGPSADSAPITVESHDYITDDGLVAYWSFDEGNGGTMADLTGHGHVGKETGEVSWTQGIRDTPGLEFHGTGNAQSHIEVKDNPDLNFSATQSFSIVAWARPSSLPGHWAGVLAKSRETPSGWYGVYISPDNKWTFRGAEDKSTLSGGTVVANTWQQVVAVQDGVAKTRTLYVNGVQVATAESTQTGDGSGALWIGQGNADQEGFAGIIDDVRIYNRPLSAADVTKLFGTYLPVVAMTGPADNATVSGADPVALTATASTNDGASINEVKFYQGTKQLGDSRDAPFHYDWRNAVAGDYSITAVVNDSNGNTVTSAPIHLKITQ